ncbi:MAG: hypothetical protein B6D77_16485 [gamma proteobacterium symbiont of Ctena orbiculata]|nr:MAG: hypothetical protein B6D77_16485 [gamma proteobacterium symbiont of Ctena orbiculata]PVV21330.1 MAG: hypothetical protein B6D78_08230 [gamma proteobacterium symbiont of Ctena orbiculata]PVV24973.1 MAG: hypothetical protein B6D79_10115 [gamma proteobacterium symbiont of Ctena orbiculata]
MDGRYLHVVIYTNGELEEQDIKPVTDYLDRFNTPLPALMERKGRYSISIPVQIAMLQQTKSRLKAVAFIERDHKDVIMTRIAASTYFKDIAVKSFFDMDQAIDWLSQHFCQTPLLPDAQNSA